MTDELLGNSASTGVENPGTSNLNAGSVASSGSANERVFTQEQVNKLIHERTKSVRDNALAEGKNEALRTYSSTLGTGTIPQPTSVGISNEHLQAAIASQLSAFTEKAKAEIDRKHQEEQQKRAEESYKSFIGQVGAKLKAAEKDYPDYEQKVAPVSNLMAVTYPHLLQMAHGSEMFQHLMYEFAQDPQKLIMLGTLAESGTPQGRELAQTQLNTLGDSIKKNRDALQTKSPNKPLDRFEPSIGKTDNGEPTIQDLRRYPAFKV